jgi:hypothetical protein
MKPEQPTWPGASPGRDPNQGEGDRVSARHYNEQVEEFVAEGKVDSSAREAERYVETQPDDAARAERSAKRGPHPTKVTLDELIGMGRTMLERVRPYVERGVGRLRARFHRK